MINYCSFCDMTLPQGEQCKCQFETKKGIRRFYDNGDPVRVGDYATINNGPHAGKRAEVIESGACVYVSVAVRPNSTQRIEIEIHESWLTVEQTEIYVGGNIGKQRVFYKVSNYNQARYVAENIEHVHGRVTINYNKPKKDQTVFTEKDKPHFYKFNGYGRRA